MRACERDTVLRLIQPQTTPKMIKRDSSKILMEGVCTGLTSSLNSVNQLSQSLLYPCIKEGEDVIGDLIRSSLISNNSFEDKAQNNEEEHEKEFLLTPTQLGQAVLASSLPPDAALFVFSDLQRASKALAIDTELHMLYLVTPANSSIWQGCDWHHLHKIFTTMESDSKRIAKLVGVSEHFIFSRIQQRAIQANDRDLQLHLRFFSALALFDLVNEKPLADVAHRFQIPRGALQTLQQQSATYAAMVVAFCSRLGWQYFRSLLDGFALRLAFGVRSELTELVRIEGMDGSRARVFHEKDLSSLAQLANASVDEVGNVLSLAVPFNQTNDNDGKNEWLAGDERMTLKEAAQLLIERANLLVKEQLKSLGFAVTSIVKEKEGVNEKTVYISQNPKSQQLKSEMYSQREAPYQPMSQKSYLCQETPACSSGFGSQSQSLSQQHSLYRKSLRENNDSFEDDSIDLFSNTFHELSINEAEEPSDNCRIINTSIIQGNENGEINDLETSLLLSYSRILQTQNVASLSYTEDMKEREEIENIIPLDDEKENEIFEDSFDAPLQFKPPTLPQYTQVGNKRLSVNPLVINSSLQNVHEISIGDGDTSADLFDECSPIPTKLTKRHNKSIWSPSVSSPLCKISRRHSLRQPTTLVITDVCQSLSSWKSFVARSANWTQVGISVINDKKTGAVDCIALCGDHSVDFIPFSENYYPGTVADEQLAPSGTPDQNITEFERIAHVASILRNCSTYGYDILETGTNLWRSHEIMIDQPKCVEYLGFLAHYRHGENPISLQQLTTKYEWDFDVSSFFKRGPRIQCAISAFVLPRLFEKVRPSAVRQSSEESINLEIDSIRAVLKMVCNGFAFSLDKCNAELNDIRKKMNAFESECHAIARKSFNLDSPVMVSDVLFNLLKLPHPGGRISTKQHLPTNKAVLEGLRDVHPIVNKILTFRSLKHTVSQCLLPLSKCVDTDGRIRTSMQICTATGRILSNRPNIQNVPKGKSDSFCGRALFEVKEGYSLIAADYCQLELRVLAHLSADKELCARLANEERDFFKDLSTEWGFSRDSVKQLCYGLIYGMGVRSLADATGSSIEEAQKLIDSFFKSFPGVLSYVNNTKDISSKIGFVSTMLGRRRITKNHGRQDERAQDDRQSMNFTIQGTASEIFKKAILNIVENTKDLDCSLVMTVHDEVIVECRSNILPKVRDIIRDSMQNVFTLRLPLRVKIAAGRSWGDLSD